MDRDLVTEAAAGSEEPNWTTRLKLAGFALLGHGFVLGLAIAALASAGGLFLLFRSIQAGAGYLILLKLGVPLLVFGWCSVRALWVASPPPDGVPVKETDAPRLWAVIRELERDLETPRIHQVNLYGALNAAIGRYPRLGLLGWPKNVLFLGMPWLMVATPDQVRAGIAHELAHLSRKHNWTTRLVGRAHATAEGVQAKLSETYQSSQLLTARFFDWYQPALARRAMALSRQHEFEADRLAAETTGYDLVAQDLVVTEVGDVLLDEQFWSEINVRYKDGAPCPEQIFQELQELLAAGLDVTDAADRMEAALATRSGEFCSHPSLAERLAALGVSPELPDLRPAVDGASHFFEDRLDHYIERVSEDWRADCADDWEDRATWLKETKEEIAALESEAARGSLDVAGLSRLALLLEWVHGPEAASRRDLELLERDPDHLRAHWRLGRAALEAGHADGLPLIMRLMRLDWRAIPAGTAVIREAEERATIELRPELEDELEQLGATHDAVEAEFDTTTSFDLLEPHGLDAATVRRLTELVQSFPQIREALLVRKRTKCNLEVSGLVLGIAMEERWTSALFGTDFGSEDRLIEALTERAELSEFFIVTALTGERLLKNRMSRVPSAMLVSRRWHDFAFSTPAYTRRTALAGFAAVGVVGFAAWDGTRGWAGSREAMAWALGEPQAPPSLPLNQGLFAKAHGLAVTHGGLEAAYRAHAALDAALVTAVAYWRGRLEKVEARQELMAQRDEARRAGQQLLNYLDIARGWHDPSGNGLAMATLETLAAHEQDVRNNITNVAILLNDDVGPDTRGRLIGLHLSMRGPAFQREFELYRALSSNLAPESPEQPFLEATAATIELQRGLLSLMHAVASAPQNVPPAVVEPFDALMSEPGIRSALQATLGTRDTLNQLAPDLAAESGLDLTPTDIDTLAKTYWMSGRAGMDAYNVALGLRSDLRTMIEQDDTDPAEFLQRAVQANRDLNRALAARSAAAWARFDWMLDLTRTRAA